MNTFFRVGFIFEQVELLMASHRDIKYKISQDTTQNPNYGTFIIIDRG